MATSARTIAALAVALFLLSAFSCQKTSASSGKAAASDAEVARIVFIDKEDACDCTRKRADDSWASLEEALGDGAAIPVERIYMDTEESRAAPYLEMQQLMVVPGIYFIDSSGALVTMLQGEQTTAKLAAALGR